MEVLVCKDNENVIKGISTVGICKELGDVKYTQRVIMQKAGSRLCVLYSENSKGKQTKIHLEDGDTLVIRGTFIICRDIYGAYSDISLDDIGDIMLRLEE